MKLIRLRLKDFRGIVETELRFDGANITIVEGPNESGKSSVADALTYLRREKDSTSKQSVKNLQPKGRSVGTEIELEARSGPYHFTYFKRFNHDRTTTLTIHEPTVDALTGDTAHQRAVAIFDETLDAQLWDALQITQGRSLEQSVLADIQPLKGALEASTGEDGSTRVTTGLLDRVFKERARYLTDATGQPRDDYRAALHEVTRLEQRRDDLSAKLAAADVLTSRHARGVTDLVDRRVARIEMADRVAHLEARRADLEVLERTLELAVARHEHAITTLQGATASLRARVRLVEELAVVADARTLAEKLAGQSEEALLPLAAAFELAHGAVGEAKVAHTNALVASREATQRWSTARACAEAASLSERVQRIVARQAMVQELTTYLDTHRVDDAVVHEISTADLRRQTLAAQRDASAPRLRVERLGTPTVTVDGIAVEHNQEATVLGTAVVQIDDLVRVTVTSGEQSVDVMALADEADAAYRDLLLRHGVDDVTHAQRAAAERRQRQERLAVERLELASAVGDDTREALEQRLATLRASGVSDLDHDVSVVDLERAATTLSVAADAATGAYELAMRGVDRARAVRDDAQASAREALQQVGLAQATCDAVSDRLDEARRQESDEALHVRLTAYQTAVDSSRDAVDEARQALTAAGADGVNESLAMATAALERLDIDIEAINDTQNQLVGQVEQLGVDGLRDDVDITTALLADAQRSLDSHRARAEAADLLTATLRRHHADAQQRYVAPFKAQIEALGAHVFGPDFAVTITPDLTIESRTLNGVTIGFDQLSGGAREQLAVLGRLACAQLVDPADGAPLIIDDAFGFADDARLLAMAQVFNAVGQTAQIIILTCYPKRFRDIGTARTIRLG